MVSLLRWLVQLYSYSVASRDKRNSLLRCPALTKPPWPTNFRTRTGWQESTCVLRSNMVCFHLGKLCIWYRGLFPYNERSTDLQLRRVQVGKWSRARRESSESVLVLTAFLTSRERWTSQILDHRSTTIQILLHPIPGCPQDIVHCCVELELGAVCTKLVY